MKIKINSKGVHFLVLFLCFQNCLSMEYMEKDSNYWESYFKWLKCPRSQENSVESCKSVFALSKENSQLLTKDECNALVERYVNEKTMFLPDFLVHLSNKGQRGTLMFSVIAKLARLQEEQVRQSSVKPPVDTSFVTVPPGWQPDRSVEIKTAIKDFEMERAMRVAEANEVIFSQSPLKRHKPNN